MKILLHSILGIMFVMIIPWILIARDGTVKEKIGVGALSRKTFTNDSCTMRIGNNKRLCHVWTMKNELYNANRILDEEWVSRIRLQLHTACERVISFPNDNRRKLNEPDSALVGNIASDIGRMAVKYAPRMSVSCNIGRPDLLRECETITDSIPEGADITGQLAYGGGISYEDGENAINAGSFKTLAASNRDSAAKKTGSQGRVFVDTATGMEFVLVKGGCYQMGDTFGDGYNNERPVHEVCLDDFYVGKFKVTQGQWKAVMGYNPSYFKNCGDNCPVENISWDDAQQFIRILNQRTGKSYRLLS